LRAAAVLAVLVLVASCGGDDGGDGGDGGGSEFADQSGQEIADAAKADMKELDQVAYRGEISSSEAPITMDIQASSGGDCTGTLGIGGGSAEVVAKGGTSWFRPDEALWRERAPDQADAIIAAVGDKWVLDADGEFAQFCDLDDFFDNIFEEDGNASEYETVGTDEIDGQDVVKVEQTDADGSATGYVLVEGEHYLLRLERTEGDDPGQLEFSEFNEEFEVEAPAEDEVVDLSQL
jgi:hypothetical protein